MDSLHSLGILIPRITLGVLARRCGIQSLGFSQPSIVSMMSDEKTLQYVSDACVDVNCVMLSTRGADLAAAWWENVTTVYIYACLKFVEVSWSSNETNTWFLT
ncbi:hypothetical protein TNCV_2541941 [Trichonephila clavipes]|nr:hypothetical protein TNCV_2541941 [Trichonephila clavipes]